MRTSDSRPVGLRLVAGLAVAIPAIALSALLGAVPASADPEVSPTPTPTVPAPTSPAPTNPAPEQPGKPSEPGKPSTPGKPGEAELDSEYKITGPTTFEPGALAKLTLTATSGVPTRHLPNLKLPEGLRIESVPPVEGWELDVEDPRTLQGISNGDLVKNPRPIEVWVTATNGVKRTGVISGYLFTPHDRDRSNNVPKLEVVIEGAGAIKGLAWHDQNRDGLQGKEPGVEGALVLLYSLAGAEPKLVNAADTDAQGRYSFKHQPLGKYGIAVVAPDTTWDFTRPDAGDDAKDSDVATASKKLNRDVVVKGLRARSGAKKAEKADEEKIAYSKIIVVDGKADQIVDAGLTKGGPQPSGTASPAPTKSPVPGDGGSLPVTGAGLTAAIGSGLLILLSGVALVLFGRRRRALTPTE